jgi:hypothetical protein
VLFDLLLDGCVRAFGPAIAQRIVVSLAVALFVSGAFAFAMRVSGRRPVHMLPILAILAYGWVFRMGFFNFYLSLAICFWVLALVWDWNPRTAVLSLPLITFAWMAHLLPVIWTVAVLAYHWIAPRPTARSPFALPAAALGGILALDLAIHHFAECHWFSEQLKVLSGADQAYIYNDKYTLTFAGAGLMFAWLFVKLIRAMGWRKVAGGSLFQVTALSMIAIAVLPSVIIGANFQAAYLANRMSLVTAVCLCALMAVVRPSVLELYGACAIAAVFFGFSYYDERNLNLLEDQFEAVAAPLPPMARVVSALHDSSLHVDPLVHMVDRVCIGRCYSYANYEPATKDFRIRVNGAGPIVAATYLGSWQMQQGRYIVGAADLPLYQIGLDSMRRVSTDSLGSGPMRGLTEITVLPELF